jgi:hypothetical protein
MIIQPPHSGLKKLRMIPALNYVASWYIVRFIRPWRQKTCVLPKSMLTFNWLYSVICQKIMVFITTAVWTSNPTHLNRFLPNHGHAHDINTSSDKQISPFVEFRISIRGHASRSFYISFCVSDKPSYVRNYAPVLCYLLRYSYCWQTSTPVIPILLTWRPILGSTKSSYQRIPISYLSNCIRTDIVVYNHELVIATIPKMRIQFRT